MKRTLLALSLLMTASLVHAASLTVSNLRCEYLADPLAVDVAQPRLSWVLETQDASARGVRQKAYQIRVAADRASLEAGKPLLWDSGKVASERTNQIAYAGKPLTPAQECWWSVQVWDVSGKSTTSNPARWTMGLMDGVNWNAEWIGVIIPEVKPQAGAPAAFLRKAFGVDKPVRRALLQASALGNYEIHLNGQKVGADYFTPGYTDSHKTVYYNTYDVTPLLKSGSNALGAILASGWYAGAMGWTVQRNVFGTHPHFSAQLEIEFTDGTRQEVLTDSSWRAAFGPILEADHLHGCVYDARKELPGWDTASYEAPGWSAPFVSGSPDARLSAYPGEPVRKTQELAAKAVTEPKPGVFIFDLGQNMVGWARLKTQGAPGQKVTLRFGEMLNNDGTLYTANLRKARATDTFFLKGSGEEIYEPYFTFHGFRYVEVTGLETKPAPETVTGVVVHSDLAQAGAFECSHPLVNQLYRNITWGMRGNYLEIPTDCPQRDERMGWMGDAQAFVRTGACLRDIAPFFTKWMVDVEDAQGADGMFTDVAPRGIHNGGGVAGWGDAGVICPWTIYEVYGDTRILERHYNSMTRWISYLQNHSKDLIRPDSGYGDWLAPYSSHPPEGDTPRPLLGTAYFAHSTDLVARAARVLGKKEDAQKYEALARDIRAAFNKEFVSPDGKVQGETQTGYILALSFHLVPESLRPEMARRLIEQIEKRDGHLSTGFLGVNLLMPTLTDIGRTDVAYRLLENTTYPSWGYSIVNGATTVWERWNSYTKEKGFGDVGMNSFNHYAYGSVGQWMFATLAGIDSDGPGFRRLLIHPRPGGSLTSAKASYDSINGLIATDWKLDGGKFSLTATIPCNTTATVFVPARDAASVTENGVLASKSKGVKFLRMQDGAAVYEVGSGHYQFEGVIKSGAN